MSFIYFVHSFYLRRETILNVMRTPVVTKRGMYAAKNPLSVTGLLLGLQSGGAFPSGAAGISNRLPGTKIKII